MNVFLAPKSRPLVVGHRGVPALHQENTLAGYRRAVELGIPAAELDVRLSRDGRAVLVHDTHLGRLTGRDACVRDLTWDQLSRLRVRRELPMGIDASGAEVVVRYEREEPIALLEEVLAEVGGRLALNVELKLNEQRWWLTEVGAVTAREIERAGLVDRVIVTSFDPRKLRAAARTCPGLALGFCYDDSMLDWAAPVLDRVPLIAAELTAVQRRRHALGRMLDGNLAGRLLRTHVVGAEHTLVGPRTVARLHAAGVAVGTHTLFPIGSTTGKPIDPAAMTAAEVERLVGLGVDWIEADDPAKLLALVG